MSFLKWSLQARIDTGSTSWEGGGGPYADHYCLQGVPKPCILRYRSGKILKILMRGSRKFFQGVSDGYLSLPGGFLIHIFW